MVLGQLSSQPAHRVDGIVHTVPSTNTGGGSISGEYVTIEKQDGSWWFSHRSKHYKYIYVGSPEPLYTTDLGCGDYANGLSRAHTSTFQFMLTC